MKSSTSTGLAVLVALCASLAAGTAFPQTTATPSAAGSATTTKPSDSAKPTADSSKPSADSSKTSADASAGKSAGSKKFSKSQIEAFLTKCSDEADAKGLDVKKGKSAERKAFRRECMRKLGVEPR